MLIWCSVGWWHSVTAAILEQDWRVLDVQVAFLPLCLLEPKAEQPDGHELYVWDLKISRRGSARSADATVQGKLVDAALCLPLGLNEIRKSGLDSVLSLLSSGSTCFLTLDLFFCHLPMGLADNDFLPISMSWTHRCASSFCPGLLLQMIRFMSTIVWPHHCLTVLARWFSCLREMETFKMESWSKSL